MARGLGTDKKGRRGDAILQARQLAWVTWPLELETLTTSIRIRLEPPRSDPVRVIRRCITSVCVRPTALAGWSDGTAARSDWWSSAQR